MKRVYLVVRNKDTKKTIRMLLPDVATALGFLNDISTEDFADVTEIKMEFD